MKNFIQINHLKPADRIIVPKSVLGIIDHHAVYLGKNYAGQDLIAENVFGQSVRIITADEFSIHNPIINRIETFKGTGLERKEAVEHALRLIGRPYDLINFNCEHFANEVQHKISFSPQVKFAFGLLGFIALVIIISKQ